MKLNIYLLFILITFSSCSMSPEKSKDDLVTIHLEKALENPSKITASMLGKSVRYVPLETSDVSIIGNNPSVRVVEDKIIVASEDVLIKVFDALSGKFLYTIGELGNGPRASLSLALYVYNSYKNQLWIWGSEAWRVWNVDGTFDSSVKLPAGSSEFSVFQKGREFVDAENLVIYDGADFVFYGTDSIYKRIRINNDVENSLAKNYDVIITKKIEGISGTLLDDYAYQFTTRDNRKVFSFGCERPFFRYGGKLYFKNIYENMAYRVESDMVVPAILFEPGKYNLPYEEIGTALETNKKVKVAQVLENDKHIFFECAFGEGLYGLYTKEDGTLVTGNAKEKIRDDINDFISFNIYSTTSNGKFVGVIDAFKVAEWNEQNPQKKSLLPNIQDNNNIVIAIIE